jgi:hypothetical protein
MPKKSGSHSGLGLHPLWGLDMGLEKQEGYVGHQE